MNLNELTRAIFAADLESAEERARLKEEVLNRDFFWVLPEEETSDEDWENNRFEPYVASQNTLVVFLSESDAAAFADWADIKTGSGEPMTRKFNKRGLLSFVAAHADKGLVKEVYVFAHPPVHLAMQMQELYPDEDADPDTKTDRWKGVDKVRDVLEASSTKDRKFLDPGGRCQNVHTLIEDLCIANRIDHSEMDQKLNMPNGMTKNFCHDVKKSDYGKRVIKSYLDFFGLGAYLYRYKNDCIDIIQELNAGGKIDQFSPEPARGKEVEEFVLQEITRREDEQGCYVYELSMQSPHRTASIFLSDPVGRVVGKKYQIKGYPPLPGQRSEKTGTAPVGEGQGGGSEELKREQRSESPKQERTKEAVRHDDIIRYFRKSGHEAINAAEAERRYQKLATHPDILENFHRWITENKKATLSVSGYNAHRLVRVLKFAPYEAHLWMIELREDGQNARQQLKYRERNPQYQS